MVTTVVPPELEAQGAVLASLVAEVSAEVAAAAVPITALVPAGLDDASLLASASFAAHGAQFVAQAASGMAMLANAAAAATRAGVVYAGQEAANTALL